MSLLQCPICPDAPLTLHFIAADFDGSGERFEVHRCTYCGTGVTHPAPGPDEIGRYYAPAYYGQGNRKFSALVEWVTTLGQRRLAADVLRQWSSKAPVGARARVLDIGCGRANLLRSLHAMDCECHGIERDDFPVQGLPAGITIHKRPLEELGFADGHFDIVVIWHVLEHLHTPVETLREIERVLKRGGLLVLAVPNFGSWQARLFRQNWFHLDLPRHLYHFTREGLARGLGNLGYELEKVHTCSLSQGLFGAVQSVMNGLPFGPPNRFYELLKHRAGVFDTLQLIAWLVPAGLLAPFALAGFALSCLFGQGACLMESARTRPGG